MLLASARYTVTPLYLRDAPHNTVLRMLFDRDGFREVSGLVYVAASADGYVVGEELEGDYFEDGQE